jgi:tetratricopeptide (TPR) repeat protein
MVEVLKDATAAWDDYERHQRLESLNQAIIHFQNAANIASQDSPALPAISNELGKCLAMRFERLGNLADINGSITRHEMAVNLTPDGDSDKPTRLSNLGNALEARFNRLGNLANLEDAIRFKQAAVDLTPESFPRRHMYLNNLGNALESRFRRCGNLRDLEEAIKFKQAAVNLTLDDDPYKSLYLTNLGNSLEIRFLWLGNLVDIDNAIKSNQVAVNNTPDSHPKKAMYLNNLGRSLRSRFQRLGNLADLDEAITSNRAAVKLMPDGHPYKSGMLSNLGISLETRSQRLGDLADIDDAIIANRAAVNLTSDNHPDKPARLSNLGVSLTTRFKRLGNLADIDDAISSERAAVALTPDGHPDKSMYLSNLGTSLQTRFLQLGNLVDIDDSITFGQAAADLIPNEHPQKAVYLSNLGSCYETRFQRLENISDLNDAIASKQAAVDLTPDGHPNKSMYLTNLGNSLEARYHSLGNLVDLDSAVSFKQMSTTSTPDDHPNKIGYLTNLGNAFWSRFLQLERPDDVKAAILNLSAAAMSQAGPPILRFRAAKKWSFIASETGHPSLLAAYECAVTIMPLVAWLGLPISDRHQHLVEIGGISRDAAAAAISHEEYDKALEWLEQGRSIVWTQILQLRTPMDHLRDVKPNFAERLVQISRVLDQGLELGPSPGRSTQPTEEQGQQYRALTRERESIIQQVRSLPNFENFLKPPNSLQIKKAAQDGPVVVLNIAEQRCDALALVPALEDVIHVPLPNILPERVTELANELKDLLYSTGVRVRAERAAKKVEEETDEGNCKSILAELWSGMVKPVLDALAFSVRFIDLYLSQPTDDVTFSLNLMHCLVSGGVPQAHLLFSRYMPPEYTIWVQWIASLAIMLYPRTLPLYLPCLNHLTHLHTRLSNYFQSSNHQHLVYPVSQIPVKSWTTYDSVLVTENMSYSRVPRGRSHK